MGSDLAQQRGIPAEEREGPGSEREKDDVGHDGSPAWFQTGDVVPSLLSGRVGRAGGGINDA